MILVSAWDWLPDAGCLLMLPLLIALNGAFVAAQFALVALRRTRVEEMVRQGVHGAGAVRDATDNLDRCVAATQVGTVLVGLLLGWFGEPALASLLEPLFDFLEKDWHLVAVHSLSTILTFFFITFLSVVFGELIPKTVGLQNSERTALIVSRPLLWFTRLAHPVIALMDGTGNWILRRLGYDLDAEGEKGHSVDELVLLIEDTAEAGVISDRQATFVTNVLKLSERRVSEVLVPIDKVGVLDFNAPLEVTLERIREGTYTRMPVYHGNVNQILGVANTKQLHRLYIKDPAATLDQVMYPALFVLPTDALPTALKVMRQERFPLAIVREESGKVLGILTLDDVIQQVIGEIMDEHDYPAPKLTPRMLQALIQAVPKRKGPRPTIIGSLPPES